MLIAAVGLGAYQPPPSTQVPKPTIVQPGAPGQASTVVTSVPRFNDNHFIDADVKFMQGMIHHHSQALVMVRMIATHTKSPELAGMGQKIQLSHDPAPQRRADNGR